MISNQSVREQTNKQKKQIKIMRKQRDNLKRMIQLDNNLDDIFLNEHCGLTCT